MPSLRRRTPDPKLFERVRSELNRVLAALDDAAVTGNLAKLRQSFAGDALSEIQARFSAYQMAGIQVSPFRESLHLEVDPNPGSDSARARIRYRDRTSFMCAGAAPTSANDPVLLLVSFDRSHDPWLIVSIVEQ